MWRILLTGLVVCLGLTTLAPAWAQEKEKTGGGLLTKSLDEWLVLLRTSEKIKEKKAILLLLEVGIQAKEGEFYAKLKGKLPEIQAALTDALTKDKNAEIRATAAQALGTVGALGKTAPGLEVGLVLQTALAEDKAPEVRQAAAKALGGKMVPLAPNAVPALAKALLDSDSGTSNTAATTLKDYGEDALKALPELLAAGKNTKLDAYTRIYTLQILQAHLKDAGKMVPLLTEVLKEKEAPTTLKQTAVNNLASYFRDAEPATSPLLDILKDEKAPVVLRQSAAATLGKIQAESAKVWPVVKMLMKEGNAAMRSQAIRLAAKLCKSEKELIPALIVRCDDDNADAQIAAIQELGDMGSAAKTAEATLKRLSESAIQTTVRQAATAALKKIQG